MAVPLPVPPSIANNPQALKRTAIRRFVQAGITGVLFVFAAVVGGPIVLVVILAAVTLGEFAIGLWIYRAAEGMPTNNIN